MNIAKKVSSYLGVIGTAIIVAALLATIYLAPAQLHWVTFLGGILSASVLAMVVRASRAEWAVSRRSAQLSAVRAKLAREIVLRTRSDEALASVRRTVQHVDLSLPAMVVYVDEERVLRFHNAAFRAWLGVKGDQIDGRALREVMKTAEYADIIDRIGEALGGHMTVAESTLRTPKGETFRLAAQYLPHFGEKGKVLGAFALLTDITAPQDVVVAPPVSSIAADLSGGGNVAERLKAALERDEFCLYCQAIVPAKSVAVAAPFYEILIRLTEEERNLMPPGVFLQLAEEHGVLPDLDRWVVRHLLDWAGADRSRQNATYSVNVSGPTLSDEGFIAFVAGELRGRTLRNFTLCFEFAEAQALQRPADAARFVRRMRQEGCRTALSGFGRNLASFDLLKQLPVDYLKIDSGIVLAMLRGPVELSKVKAINRVAHEAGIATIAECVENEETFAALRELAVDFAQGFGVSRPLPLAQLKPEAQRRRPKDPGRAALSRVA